MKRVIGIALVLALAVTLCLSTVALAQDPPDEINTSWNFDGEGEINIHTEKTGGSDGEDHLNVVSSGSGSLGWSSVSAPPNKYPHLFGTNFKVDRYAEIEDGYVSTWTVRDNNHSHWGGYTEHGAYLGSSGAGDDGILGTLDDTPPIYSSGTLEQHFGNSYYSSYMNTDIHADCPYVMGAMVEGSDVGLPPGDKFLFNVWAEGDGGGDLHLHTTDMGKHGGCRLLWGGFHIERANSNAGFYAKWDNVADFGGTIWTPDLTEYFNTDVGDVEDKAFVKARHWTNATVTSSSPGWYGDSASGAWVTIDGFINGMK